MTDLRTAAQQALEALEADNSKLWPSEKRTTAITAIRAALAEPEGGGNLPPPLQKPEEFDHSIGADRFKVMRGAFWWHVLIGDSPTEHGKFRSRAGAEKMAADLLREFRNGAFVQHEAALAEPVQEFATTNIGCLGMPVNTPVTPPQTAEPVDFVSLLREADEIVRGKPTWKRFIDGTPLSNDIAVWMTVFAQDVARRADPPQRKPLTDEEIHACFQQRSRDKAAERRLITRAIERMHGIGGEG